MAYAMARLNLTWLCEKQEVPCGRLDEGFLMGHDRSFPVSLPFLLNIHTDPQRTWKKLIQHAFFFFSTFKLCECGGIMRVGAHEEETLPSYLSIIE